MANSLLNLAFLLRNKRVRRIQRLLHFMPHFVADDLLAHLQQRHILFQARDVYLQLLEGHRQPLIAKIQVLAGILCVIQQLMGSRSQGIERRVGVSGVNQFTDRLFE
ncbi:hypothetical protein D3C72_1009240 [compost metagenome]